MKSLKIGVLTFHRCINYGSYWQARCLTEGLSAMGHEVELMDHHSGKVNMAEWKCAFQPELPLHHPAEMQQLYRYKILRFQEAFDGLSLSAPFALEQPSNAGCYDIVIVGSDEVWNLFHPWYGGCLLFFGEGIQASKLVAYAASFGNYDACWLLEDKWKQLLNDFDAISVRDENSFAILQQNIQLQAPVVLDPCLQFASHIQRRSHRYANEAYVAVYGHNFSAEFINIVTQWAKQHGSKLVSIGYYNEWADEHWIDAGPLEFPGFMADAKAVITNFFHGCVFALNYSHPFVCEPTYYRANKLRGLMDKVGAEQHMVDTATAYSKYVALLSAPPDAAIAKNINRLRQMAVNFFKDALVVNKALA